jgi:hypothetical protein
MSKYADSSLGWRAHVSSWGAEADFIFEAGWIAPNSQGLGFRI